jgi:hypothetical protein
LLASLFVFSLFQSQFEPPSRALPHCPCHQNANANLSGLSPFGPRQGSVSILLFHLLTTEQATLSS